MLQGLQGCRQVQGGIQQSLAERQQWTRRMRYSPNSGVSLLRDRWSHHQVLPKARQRKEERGKVCSLCRPRGTHPVLRRKAQKAFCVCESISESLCIADG